MQIEVEYHLVSAADRNDLIKVFHSNSAARDARIYLESEHGIWTQVERKIYYRED